MEWRALRLVSFDRWLMVSSSHSNNALHLNLTVFELLFQSLIAVLVRPPPIIAVNMDRQVIDVKAK
jgi:hypothetical protein